MSGGMPCSEIFKCQNLCAGCRAWPAWDPQDPQHEHRSSACAHFSHMPCLQAVLAFQAWNTLPLSHIADFPPFFFFWNDFLYISVLDRCDMMCASHEVMTEI